MALQIGIVGLPNAGKSTLFNALTQANAGVANYPFTTIDPHIGMAAVPDHRLDSIAGLIEPEKVVPASVRFVDIAGLVRGAHQGEGLGNQFLANIREVDAIATVLRCFTDADIPHISETMDPLEDLAVLDLELCLADLVTVERRIERTQSAAKSRPKEYHWELEMLDALRSHLSAGRPASIFPGGYLTCLDSQALSAELGQKRALLAELFLLTDKPRLLVANVGEDDLPGGGHLAGQVLREAEREGQLAVVLCAECEAALAEWPAEEGAAYRAELGLTEAGVNRLIRTGYQLLDLITFITVTGGEVVRAWSLKRGLTVWHAAGEIHTDMQRGFIRADVIDWQELASLGSMAQARDAGRLRSEGRDYVIQDGDVIHIHFSN